MHEAEEDEADELLDFRAVVLELEEHGDRQRDDHCAGEDVEDRRAVPEVR